MPADIDILPTTKSVIDLSALPKNSFGSALYGFKLKALMDDIMLVKYEDETDDGQLIKRKGLFVPVNTDTKAWRIGRVILAGPNTKAAKVGMFVMFPNNLGIPIANIEVDGYGTLKTGIFLNEERIFGVADTYNINESVAKHNKDLATK